MTLDPANFHNKKYKHGTISKKNLKIFKDGVNLAKRSI